MEYSVIDTLTPFWLWNFRISTSSVLKVKPARANIEQIKKGSGKEFAVIVFLYKCKESESELVTSRHPRYERLFVQEITLEYSQNDIVKQRQASIRSLQFHYITKILETKYMDICL